MPLFRAILATCPWVLILLTAAAAADGSVCDIAQHPDAYDHKQVEVLGLASDIKKTTSQSGHDYTVFKLIDPSGCGFVKVFAWEHPELATGERIQVDGIFETQHHQSGYTFTNELQADHIIKPK